LTVPRLQSAIQSFLRQRLAKPVLFSVYLLPLAWLVRGVWLDTLGANPAEFLIRATGDWTLRALCLVLCVSPLRVGWGLPVLARFRRMMGVFSFFYASVHLACYAWFDMGWEAADILADMAKRPFILVGFAAWLILLALCATSLNAVIRWMGGHRWQQLHRSVYVAVMLGVLHFFWMRAAKHNLLEVGVYAGILGVLLGWRVQRFLRRAALPA
jgi:sulfoxide reductase heme-binding subunit YedZ